MKLGVKKFNSKPTNKVASCTKLRSYVKFSKGEQSKENVLSQLIGKRSSDLLRALTLKSRLVI